MTLPRADSDQFYKLWLPLLKFADSSLHISPDSGEETPEDDRIDIESAVKVRDAMWENESILDQFISENPAHLSREELDILATWKYKRKGMFIIYKAFKKHTIFVSEEGDRVFAVKGLHSSFDEIYGDFLPVIVNTVLLPYKGEIITDGLYQTYNTILGPGIISSLKSAYENAKERGEVITTLMPAEPPTAKDQAAKAEATNKSLLNNFQRYEYKSGLSPKTVERDQEKITAAAQYWLSQRPRPISLLNFHAEEIIHYMDSLTEKERKPSRMSLKRFILFLEQTGRLEWDEGENILDAIEEP